MPLFTIAEALYGSSSGPFASDINVLCLISGVSAPVPILTKTGQNLLLTTVHIGDDERGTTRDSSSVSTSSSSLINASLNKQASGAGAIVEIGDDINPNVGTLTYWGGLAAESKLLVPRKASPHTSHMLQSTTSLRTGDIVLILHVARRVWMNKSTLQVRDGQSKIYILSRQDERMQQRLVRKKISAEEEGEDEDDNVTLTIDQRKELRSLLSPSDSCFLLDDIAGKQRIERLFALSRREEPLITSATLFHQSSLYTGKGLIGDIRGGGSLVHVGFSTQLDGGFSEEPNPFVRKSNFGDGGGGGGGYVEESQILPFDIDSSGATRAMSLQLSAPVSRPALPKTTPPPQAANSAAVSSPLITSCSKVPLTTGILFNISCSIRSFLRSALPVQASSVGVHSAPTTASAAAPIAVVPLSRGEDLRNNHNKHSLIELGRASLVLPQSRSQPLALSIVYCLDPQFRLATGSNVSAPTPTLAEHLCDLFFKSFTAKEKVIISNCLQRDGLIYVTSLSDVMCDSYDEDEEAFNAAHAASQRLAKQLQLQESNSRKRPRDEFLSKSPIPVTSSSSSSSSSSADVVDGSSVVDDTRKMKRTVQGKFAVTSVYLPALQLGVQQLLSEGCAFVTDLLSVPVTKVKVNDDNDDASLTLQPECNLLTEESLIDKLAFLIDTCMPSALSSSKVDAIYHPIWLKVLQETEKDLPLLSEEASKEEDKEEINVARTISGWIEFNQKFVQQLFVGLSASSIAKCVGEVNDDNKNEKVIVDKGEEEFMIMKRRKIIASSIYELLVSLMHNDSRISLVIETNKEDEGMDNNNDVIGKLSSFST